MAFWENFSTAQEAGSWALKWQRKLAVKLHGAENEMKEHVKAEWVKKRAAYAKKIAARDVKGEGRLEVGTARRSSKPQAALNSLIDPFQFVGSTPLPSFDRLTGTIERGLWCQGCDEQWDWVGEECRRLDQYITSEEADKFRRRARRAFAEQEILSHFEVCSNATRLWNKFTQSRSNLSLDSH